MAKGEVGIQERQKAPSLKAFAARFREFIQVRCKAKPNTVLFYSCKLERLLGFDFLAEAKLDQIDELLIERFVFERRKQVEPGTVNRELATLRRILRLAQEWKLIDRVPRVRLLDGERVRDFVLTQELEQHYLQIAPQPLKDISVLILDTGLRIGEALMLTSEHIRLKPLPRAKFGYLNVVAGKSKNARRTIPLTNRVAALLERRVTESTSPWVFSNRDGKPYLVTSINHLHQKVREALNLPKDFVIHSLRHTMLSRLGEAGVDAFTIMQIAGHSSITVSQRYVHPSREAVERAVQCLEVFGGNRLTEEFSRGEEPKRRLPATILATPVGRMAVNH